VKRRNGHCGDSIGVLFFEVVASDLIWEYAWHALPHFMFDALISNFQHDIALLQQYINLRQDTGFHDMERMLEALLIRVLKASHNLDLVNMNQLRMNFPAIDLADSAQRTAVQVTSNASSPKVSKTVAMFNKFGLKADYDKLIIVGFCKAKRSDSPFLSVMDMSDIVSALVDRGDVADVERVLEAVRRHNDYSKLHPYDDKRCLEIVLNCIDRSAVKHNMDCEGPIDEMELGLKDITELIAKGTIKGREKGKSMDDFQDADIRSYLRKVKDLISDIHAILNANRHGGTICLNQMANNDLDGIKREIISLSNQIAESHRIGVKLSLKTRR
jgi:hypothetical protein